MLSDRFLDTHSHPVSSLTFDLLLFSPSAIRASLISFSGVVRVYLIPGS